MKATLVRGKNDNFLIVLSEFQIPKQPKITCTIMRESTLFYSVLLLQLLIFAGLIQPAIVSGQQYRNNQNISFGAFWDYRIPNLATVHSIHTSFLHVTRFLIDRLQITW